MCDQFVARTHREKVLLRALNDVASQLNAELPELVTRVAIAQAEEALPQKSIRSHVVMCKPNIVVNGKRISQWETT